jgi:hypothetical protein
VKTTIDLADDLVVTLKKKTSEEGISMRTAIHEAIRLWLKSHPASAETRRISRDTGLVSGQGLTPEAASTSWDHLRALSYDPRG